MQRLKAEGQEPASRESTERGCGRREPPKQREGRCEEPLQTGREMPVRKLTTHEAGLEPLLPSVNLKSTESGMPQRE